MKTSAKKTMKPNRLLLEYRCSKDNRLGLPTKGSAGCKVIRYTEEDDMTTRDGLDKAMLDLVIWGGHGNIALWASIPCTGGSAWQYLNEVMYERTGNQRALRRLKGLRTIFAKLWTNFEILATAVIKREGVVVIEWPSSCRYWKDPRVQKFLRQHMFNKTHIHGCAYGLTAPCGTPIKKPWTLASNDDVVLSRM